MQNEQAFHSLSEKSSNVLVFLEVDVDDSPGVASQCEAKYMPTFQFFKKGQKVSEFSFLFFSSHLSLSFFSFLLFYMSDLMTRAHFLSGARPGKVSSLRGALGGKVTRVRKRAGAF